MVLQREKPVPIWGWAPPGAKVTVTFAGQEHSATTGKDGRWIVKLTSLTANSKGQTLNITEGKNALEIKDVLVGEVWVCSGQSNMAYSMGRAGYVAANRRGKRRDSGKPKGIPEGFDASKYPTIRHFMASRVKTPKLVDPVNVGKWSVCSDETVGGFTAVGFFFAMNLAEELDVPVGLLNCSKGSTRVETWGTGGALYLSKIRPLLPAAIRGAIWYQGEHNAGSPDGYGEKLASLITGWRKDFNQGDFPFYIVQLPNFCDPNPDPAGGDGWARIREEQFSVTTTTANTGIAVITDTGLVDNAHPDDKVTVGRRLAQWALAKDYDRKDFVHSGPLFKELTIQGDKAIVSFSSTGAGLMVSAKENMQVAHEVTDAAPGGFAMAGADKVWRWAEARIDGHTVVLRCEEVPNPIAVRYGFSGNPVRCNLYNRAGLPAAPFRTDTWDIPVEVVQDLRGMKARRAAEEDRKRKAADKKKAAAEKTGRPIGRKEADVPAGSAP